MKIRSVWFSLALATGSLAAQKADGLVGHWSFEASSASDTKLIDRVGRNHGRIEGRKRFLAEPLPPAMVFADRDDRVVLNRSLSKAGLPSKVMTVEAWVAVDVPHTWGGIVSALQDNGAFEKGWLLGFNGSKFCFALSSKGADDGDGKMTYLKARQDFRRARWYHLVGSYDGARMRLYINGVLECESAEQSGDILYPRRAVYELGAYIDDDENYPLQGLLGDVRVWRRGLSAEEVEAGYQRDRATYEVMHSASASTKARWRFSGEAVTGDLVAPITGDAVAHIEGKVGLRATMPTALILNGETSSVKVQGELDDLLPELALSIEACVWVGDRQRQHAIVVVQDAAGDDASGFRIEVMDGKFRFGVATVGGSDSMAFVTSDVVAQPFTWYHVVGTYDGSLQRIFVNGEAVGFARHASGGIVYPAQKELRFGAWRRGGVWRRMVGFLHEVAIYEGALDEKGVREIWATIGAGFPRPQALTVGPSAQFISADTAVVSWRMQGDRPTVLEYVDPGRGLLQVQVRSEGGMHEATLTGLRSERVYTYRIVSEDRDGRELSTAPFELATEFNYELTAVEELPSPYPDDAAGSHCRAAAAAILERSRIDKGYCLVFGSDDGRLAHEIARQTELQVIVIEKNLAKVRRARQALVATGFYGLRVTVIHVKGEKVPLGDYMANLIVANSFEGGRSSANLDEVLRLLRPCGGVAMIGQPATGFTGGGTVRLDALSAWVHRSTVPGWKIEEDDQGCWAFLRRGRLMGSGEWTHQYGRADNATNSGDSRIAGDLQLQWFGRPGPRGMVDRGARTPAPLYADGRLFVQGDCRLFGIDAYNGTILWSLEAPTLKRTNVPRDSSNMTVVGDRFYVAVRDSCWELDAQTGKLETLIDLPANLKPDQDAAWGYLASTDELLLGTAAFERAIYKGVDGEWYDTAGPDARDVLGRSLFALDRTDHSVIWSYADGLIIHPTITIHEGAIYFVEDRNPHSESIETGRLFRQSGKDQYLVALDLHTGKTLWEKAYDLRKFDRVMYQSAASGVLLVVGSSDRYHLLGIDASSGEELWSKSFAWKRDHHGGAMQHPVIVKDKIYLETKGIELRTGRVFREDLPVRRGCGTMSATDRSIFYRNSTHSMWDLETDKRVQMPGIRPGCWLGLIPAGGLLLAPETSSGCSCAHPVQTSAAFRPVSGK